MKNKKIIRNMIFMIILAVFFLFDGEIADALSCNYNFDVVIQDGTPYDAKGTVNLSLSPDKGYGYLDVNKFEITNADNNLFLSSMFVRTKNLRVEKGKCPSIVVSISKGGILGGHIFTSEQECVDVLGKDCRTEKLITASGTLELAEGEEIPINKECSSEQKKQFSDSVSLVYKNILSNDPSDGIESAFESHFNIFKEKEITDMASYEASIAEYKGHLFYLKNEIKELSRDVETAARSYYCFEILEMASSLQGSIARGYEEFAGMFSSLLVEKRDAWVNANDFSDEEMKKIKELDKSIEEILKEYSNEVKDETSKREEDLIDGVQFGESVVTSCEAILGDVLDIIQTIFSYMKLLAPILVIFFGSMDFAKAVVASDDKEMKKATSNFMKRLIAAVLLFFIPWFIELMFSLPGLELGIDNVICGISKVVIGR